MKKSIFAFAFATAIASFSQVSHAGLIGDTIKGDYLYPTIGTTTGSLGSGVVTGPGLTLTDYQNYFNIQIKDAKITIDYLINNVAWTTAQFNGIVLTDLTKNFSTVTLNPTTNMAGFTADRFSVSGNKLYVNWQGLSATSSTNVVFNVATAEVPEPLTVGLLGIGLLGMVASRRRKN